MSFEKFDVRVYIMNLFDESCQNGGVTLSEFWYDGNTAEHHHFYRVEWTKDNAINLSDELYQLIKNFSKLSEHYDELIEADENSLKDILPEKLLSVWRTYRPLDTNKQWGEQLQEIRDKIDILYKIKAIKERQQVGEALDNSEMALLASYSENSMTVEEWELYNKCVNARNAECEMRIGKGEYAQNVVIGGTRICKSMALSAPDFIIEREIKQFINATILHRFYLHQPTEPDTSNKMLKLLRVVENSDLIK